MPAADQANYTIEFKADGTFAAKADCNQVVGHVHDDADGWPDDRARPVHDGGLPSRNRLRRST